MKDSEKNQMKTCQYRRIEIKRFHNIFSSTLMVRFNARTRTRLGRLQIAGKSPSSSFFLRGNPINVDLGIRTWEESDVDGDFLRFQISDLVPMILSAAAAGGGGIPHILFLRSTREYGL